MSLSILYHETRFLMMLFHKVTMRCGLAATMLVARLPKDGHIPLCVFDDEGDVFPLMVSKLSEPLTESLQRGTEGQPRSQDGHPIGR
jgi:hypothetical protein